MWIWKYDIENQWILFPPAHVAHTTPELPVSQICNICCVLGESSHLIWKIGPCTVPSVYLPLSLSVACGLSQSDFSRCVIWVRVSFNTAGLVLGFISSIGISILGNFQVQYIDYKQMEIACKLCCAYLCLLCIISNPLWRGFICLGRSWPSSWVGLFLDPGMAFVLQPAVTWPQVGGASAHYPLQLCTCLVICSILQL